MDTRNKIITAAVARQLLAAHPGWKPVRMTFDAVYAPALQALAALSAPILAVIADKPDAYLSARARAEMAAGLRQVQAVVAEDIALEAIVDLTAAEAAWQRALEEAVTEKQKLLEA